MICILRTCQNQLTAEKEPQHLHVHSQPVPFFAPCMTNSLVGLPCTFSSSSTFMGAAPSPIAQTCHDVSRNVSGALVNFELCYYLSVNIYLSVIELTLKKGLAYISL